MRTIKFRAFNRKTKEWWVVELSNASLHVGLYEASPGAEKDYEDWQQFTGLHDKNGKEIYEGDAFPCIYKRDGHTDHRYYVIFNEFSGAFEYQRVGNPCPQNMVDQGMRDASRQECLGNIYENPELLGEK